jgi:glycosyltransferase involved in cell wall biosynthesis
MKSILRCPAVTVLMPVYDAPLEMLHQAIESVLSQTFADFEFLILDDGSDEERVRAGLDSWASRDARVRICHEPHRGLPGTLNHGLALARGAYIARQDADDWSEPQRLERQLAFLKNHPDVVLTSTDTYSHAADGTPLWRLRLPHASAELKCALWEGNPFVHGSTMYRRQRALEIGGYREQLVGSEDYDFFWRLTETGDSVNLDEVLYHYRFTGGSISARRAVQQARSHRAAHQLAAARRRGEAEDIQAALAAAEEACAPDALRFALKQADHFMLAGDFPAARRAYLLLLVEHPWNWLAWAKMSRLAVFRAIPQAREACFRWVHPRRILFAPGPDRRRTARERKETCRELV